MRSLQTILTQLGLTAAEHPEQDITNASTWNMGEHFSPASGKSYELILQQPGNQAPAGLLVKKIRVEGAGRHTWIDLATGQVLDPALQAAPVLGFRLLADSAR